MPQNREIDRIPAAIRAPIAPLGSGQRKDLTLPKHIPIYLPEVYPIPDAQEFNPSGSVNTVGAEVGTLVPLTPTIVAVQDLPAGVLQLPRGNVGIIRGFSISMTDMLATTNVTWSLLINGAPAGGYGTLSMFPRAQAFVGNQFDTFIRVPSGAQISVVFTNTDGGTYKIGASVSGWYWPEASGTRWLQQGF